ncbi:MAG: MFS transporter [Candidatus Dormibacteraeota bacterium]|nr:MFS transporter [Candidatus Dormibacteraeota bacterium]
MLRQPPARTLPEPPAVEPVLLSDAEIARALGPLGEAAPVVTLSDASRRSRRPLWLTRNVGALSLTDFFADSNYEMVLAVLPLFLTIALGAPALAIGIVEGVADGSASVFKFTSGYFSDRISWRKRLGAGGYAMCAAGLGLLALVTQWPQAIGARAVAWIGRGTRQPIRSSLMTQGVPKKDMGKAFGLHEAADTLGAFVGPAIAFFLLLTGHSFTFVFLVAMIPGALAFLGFSVLTRDRRNEAAKAKPRWQPMPASFWGLMAAVAAFGAGNFGVLFFTLRAFEMLVPEASFSVAAAAAVAFVLGVNLVGTLVAFPGGLLVDRVGTRPVLAVGYLLYAVASVVGAIGHGPLAVVLVALFLGTSQPLVSATESSAVGGIVDDEHQGTAFGIMAGINGLGDLVSSVVVGIIWTFVGAPVALGYGATLAVAGALLLFVLSRRPRRVQLLNG